MNIEKIQTVLVKAVKAAHIVGDSYLAEQIQEVSAAVEKYYTSPPRCHDSPTPAITEKRSRAVS